MTRQLTESLEDYLEAIAGLIAVEGHAHAKEIAGKLNVTMPSVTVALRQLEKLNYIVYKTHYPVQLTAAGKLIADEVVHRHSVLKKFFSEILGLPFEKASTTACHLEHQVDADTIRRFVLFSEAIEKRLDARELQIYLAEAVSMLDDAELSAYRTLSEYNPGDDVEIKRFGRNLEDHGELEIALNDVLTLQSFSLDKNTLNCSRKGQKIEIPRVVAENVWALKLRRE